MLGTSSASLACTTMTHWMTQQLRDGRMTGPMMWAKRTTVGAMRDLAAHLNFPPPELNDAHGYAPFHQAHQRILQES
jgi:hypothetical protein